MLGLIMKIAMLLAIILVCSCGQNVQENELGPSFIYGGSAVNENQWPTVIALTNSSSGQFCSGILLTEELVLTAAHCVYDVIKSEYDNEFEYLWDVSIHIGQGTDSYYQGSYSIKKAVSHPKYDFSKKEIDRYDFAYLLLRKPIPLPSKPLITTLPKELEDSIYKIKIPVTIVGFGKRDDGTRGTKHQVDTNIWQIGKTEFYAGGGSLDACQGDSGAPIFLTSPTHPKILLGITSGGIWNTCGLGSRFGKINIAINWLKSEGLLAN